MQVSWYQLFGRPVEAFTQKVHLGDCSLPGTGNMVQFLLKKGLVWLFVIILSIYLQKTHVTLYV